MVLLVVSGLRSFLDDEPLLIVELLNQNAACSVGANGSHSYARQLEGSVTSNPVTCSPEGGRKYGISDATFYKSRSRYGGMEVSDARKLKALEDGNRRLKKLLAETMLDASTLKEMLGKTSDARLAEKKP